MNIRPSAAIRQNYNEIADMCRKTAEPIFLTKKMCIRDSYDVFSGSSRPFNKEEWAAQKQAQRQEAYELIDNTCEKMMADGGVFQQYLDVQGRFDRYSVNNAILVAVQMPEATQLKEKSAWKNNRCLLYTSPRKW